jgi:hypothetical protein
MAPYARLLAVDGLVDESALAAMETRNKEEIEKLDARIKEVEETEGETEMSDALRARASYLTRIGDKVSTWLLALVILSDFWVGSCSRSAEACPREDARSGCTH